MRVFEVERADLAKIAVICVALIAVHSWSFSHHTSVDGWGLLGHGLQIFLELCLIAGIVQQTRRLQRRSSQIASDADILRQVIDTVPHHIFARDREGRFILLNKVAAQIHGAAAEQLVGRLETEYNPNLPDGWMAEILACNQAVMESGQPQVFSDNSIVDIEGNTQWLETSIFPYCDRAGTVQGIIGHAIDVSERRRSENALRESHAMLVETNQWLNQLANEDWLTQLANRRSLDRSLEQQWQRLQHGSGVSIALVMCDIDHFKAYNDAYGHATGDQCIIAVAQVLRQSLKRPIDQAARYGGEEFLLLLPNTDLANAIALVEAVQAEFRSRRIPHRGIGEGGFVTLSFGIAVVSSDTVTAAIASPDLIGAADRALYRAKRLGRDRYCITLL